MAPSIALVCNARTRTRRPRDASPRTDMLHPCKVNIPGVWKAKRSVYGINRIPVLFEGQIILGPYLPMQSMRKDMVLQKWKGPDVHPALSLIHLKWLDQNFATAPI
jgi:hypothetical protein